MRWSRRARREWALRGVQWNLDGFASMEHAIQAAHTLVEAGIYGHVTQTETGTVILVSARDLRAALEIVEPWSSPPDAEK